MTKSTQRLIAAALVALAPLAATAQEVRNREGNQQGRIAQGVAARINASRQADRAANGRHLTAAERTNLHNRENAASANIYRDKHNNIAQPGVTPN